MRKHLTIDLSPGQLVRAEFKRRQDEDHRIRDNRQKVKHMLSQTDSDGPAMLEALGLGYGEDSARMLVDQLKDELKQERET